MADSWVQLVPTDPFFQPSADAAEEACGLLASFAPDADKVSASFKDAIEFFHPGSNWSGVQCSACGSNAEPWWGEAMDEASQSDFGNLVVRARCCGALVSLNELKYVWPAAFGRFVLEAMNPNINDLLPAQEAKISDVLGHKLRKLWVRI